MGDRTQRLLDVMARLRDPERGCPWDLEQRFETIAPYTLEEAYEVEDAIRRGDMGALVDELGDLLFQVVFHARMAEEAGHFAYDDVVTAICEKLERRHPHVFGDVTDQAIDVEGQRRVWAETKAAERARRGHGPLDDVPRALPALARTAKLVGRAASAGVAVPDEAELEGRVARGLEGDLGELLFAVAALARKRGQDPEAALREANARFEREARG